MDWTLNADWLYAVACECNPDIDPADLIELFYDEEFYELAHSDERCDCLF